MLFHDVKKAIATSKLIAKERERKISLPSLSPSCKSNNLMGSNRVKYNIAITILKKKQFDRALKIIFESFKPFYMQINIMHIIFSVSYQYYML